MSRKGKKPIIEVRGTSKSFWDHNTALKVVDDVSFDIYEGQKVSLVGPSGCGKTTILNMMAGLESIDEGNIRFYGEPVRGPNTNIGYLTQNDALLPWRGVLSNVCLPLEIKKVPRKERLKLGRNIIQKVGLEGFEKHKPLQLSGGMRKRAGLAQTLVYEPDILLLDEPFGALDAQMRILMQRQLKQLAHSLNLTLILVTHDLNEAIALSDKIIVFSKRPARICEVLDVNNSVDRDVLIRTKKDDELYAHIWGALEKQMETVS